MRRVVVVGTSGSGKTTVARELSQRLGVPHLELDALHWAPGWTETPTDVLRMRVARALDAPGWVVDGNYAKVRDLVWPRADTVVWLDYPLAVVLRQVIGRTVRRMLAREELWSGNRERLRTALSRNSIILWALQTHGPNRRQYTAAFRRPEWAHLHVVRLRSPGETRRWLSRSVDRRGDAGNPSDHEHRA